MKKIFTFLTFLSFLGISNAETTYQKVYTIFQSNCATSNCHNTNNVAGGLDLEGLGATLLDQQNNVHDNLFKVIPGNAVAESKDNYRVYPGDPYRSFLFRKISDGFSDDNPLDASEGFHTAESIGLSDYEKEVIRQWIVYGANSGQDEVDLSLIDEFYANGGIESIPAAIVPPAAGEGFQIHLGPFFIPPGAEVEYLSKYDTKLAETTEIIKFQTEMGSFSHHYIVYNYDANLGNFDPNTVAYGLRDDIGFDGKSFVLTEQYSNTLATPEGTAFKWAPNTVLDLNSHYINYSSTQIMKCEVYLNIYTQEEGTAAQVMNSQLIPNTDIPIPNNGQEVTFNYDFYAPANLNFYIWGAVAHTHQYGTDFNIYRRNIDGVKGEQVYDAGCANGIPGCAIEDFDYKHLPFRFYEPFMAINLQEGVIAEASYLNDGPVPLDWGLTSSDEMMLFVIFYTTDTAGIAIYEDSTGTSISDNIINDALVIFYPNPVENKGNLEISGIKNGESTFNVLDIKGRVIHTQKFEHLKQSNLILDTSSFNSGIYFYQLIQDDFSMTNGKFVVSK
jgi:hypothetical protein